jgi:arylformamidase
MSGSEAVEIEIGGRSAAADPEAALREALSLMLRALMAQGGAPFHLTSMHWLTADPAAFDPKRHDIDLGYREVLGGFRPPITVAKSESHEFVVQARARILKGPPPATPLFHGHTLPELAREYSPRGQVPSMDAVFAKWSEDGRAFGAGRSGLDIAYGASPYEKLDFFRPPNALPAPPLWIFIHGGYWQASDKFQHAHFAAGMLNAGYAVANLNYGLCPDVPLDGIIGQIRAALHFLVSRAKELGFDPASIHVCGHSAGGHLAAMVAVDPEMPPVRSALLLSGLFELEPLAMRPVGKLIGVTTPDAIERLSPARQKLRPGVNVGIGVGGLESDEFKWQSSELARTWGVVSPQIIEGANHFDLLDGLIHGELLNLALKTAY